MNNYQFIRCPRDWEIPWDPMPNETLEENRKRIFQEYLPGMIITKVIPMNCARRPRCSWCVCFTDLQPSAGRARSRQLYHLANQHKPRNTTIKPLRSEGLHHFIVIYDIDCNCEKLDFCNARQGQIMAALIEQMSWIKVETTCNVEQFDVKMEGSGTLSSATL